MREKQNRRPLMTNFKNHSQADIGRWIFVLIRQRETFQKHQILTLIVNFLELVPHNIKYVSYNEEC